MLNKKITPFFIFLSLLLPSCKKYTSDVLRSCRYWITDDSGFIFKVTSTHIDAKLIDTLPYINYNFLNSGYSFKKPIPDSFPIQMGTIYISRVFNKTGGEKDLCEAHFFFPKKSEKRKNIIINRIGSYYSEGDEKYLENETTKKIKTLFANDTKLIPYKLENVFLINTCGINLYNDDISLFSGYNQFSFLTGEMKDNDGNNKEVIFKCTSDTTFKVYEFINKEEVGDLLLEGEMSPIKDKDQSCSIDINVTKDYYFNNKYSTFTLNIKNTTTDIKEEYPENFEFFFPVDKE